MLRRSKEDFTVSELSILRLLWEENVALSSAEILERLPELNLFSTSIYTILDGMVGKGVLKVDGKIRRGKRFARTFVPTMSQEDFAAMQVVKLTPNVPKFDRLVGVFTALVKHDGIDEETLSSLEDFLQKQRKELDL
jgi:predicted transcriptional regulator